ncbi:MAG: ABC transporter permease [Thermoleophilia bacterium]|nr:ABC transporter permease [Thermoleophilia bacterium]
MTRPPGEDDPAVTEAPDPLNEPPATGEVSGLRDSARAELKDLAGHWSERLESFDVRDAGAVTEQRSLWKDAVRRFSHNKLAMAGFLLVVLYVLLAIFVPLGDTTEATRITSAGYKMANEGPSADHWFGTDYAGRDLWTRAWIGARISLSIALAVSVVVLAIGVLYGSISGYFGGRVDNIMMRLLDALYGLPYLPFAIITVAVVRQRWPEAPPIAYMVPALTLTTWFTAARIMRGQMLSLKQNEYVESARANGAKAGRIIGKHVIPNAVGVMTVAIFLEIPNAILGEAFLSFLGLGVQPPDTSWGQLAEDGYKYINVAPHLMWVPALLIATTVLATVAVADGVRDALDPRGQVH